MPVASRVSIQFHMHGKLLERNKIYVSANGNIVSFHPEFLTEAVFSRDRELAYG